GQRVSSNGELLGAQLVAGANPGFPPAVAMASAKTTCLAVWSDNSVSAGVDMFGQLFSPSAGKIGSAFPVLANRGSHGFQVAQCAASDGTNYLVVWQDMANGRFYGQLVTGAGALQGPEFPLFTTSADTGDKNVAVAYGKTNYLVAWQSGMNNNNQTYGMMVSRTGAAGSAFPISQSISLDYNPMAVGFDGTNYLVVWSRDTQRTSQGRPIWNLCGRFITSAGNPVGNELVLVTENAAFPAVAFDGANYLLAWGYNTDTTNSDVNIHARFIDRAGNAAGPIFTPFSAQGSNPPLLPINGLAFDGNRFVLAATFGAFVLDNSGLIVGFSGGDVYGRSIPRSTASPVFTNGTVSDGKFQGQLWVVPGQTYTIETSTNLTDWTPVGVLSSDGASFLDLVDDRGVVKSGSLFYRAVLGNRLGVSYAFNIHEFAYAGGFGAGFTPSPSYPVSLSSYAAWFDVENDFGLPAATSVFFTGPTGSGLVATGADPNNSSIRGTDGWYQSPFVSSPAVAPGGTWVVNYRGTNVTFSLPDPQAAARLVVPLPTVTVSGDVVQSVSWVYRNSTSGAALAGAPAYLTDIQVQLEGIVGGRIYDSPVLGSGATMHSLTSPVNWSNIRSLNMAYDDSLGNHYVVWFSKP
ncbi:MAG TPA: hypothetical protein VJA21_32430, partial [Verrucomicrobiae bacterium]